MRNEANDFVSLQTVLFLTAVTSRNTDYFLILLRPATRLNFSQLQADPFWIASALSMLIIF
jgi:hypothetical protein